MRSPEASPLSPAAAGGQDYPPGGVGPASGSGYTEHVCPILCFSKTKGTPEKTGKEQTGAQDGEIWGRK